MDEIRFRLQKGMDKLLVKASKELGMKPNDIAKVALQNFLKEIGVFDLNKTKINNNINNNSNNNKVESK